jgi:hypothetical protein
LSNVPGARLHITALRVRRRPGVERLEYVAPGAARPFPSDVRANDLLHTQIRVFAESVKNLFDQLAKSCTRLTSASVVTFGQAFLGFSKAGLVCAPDGHAVQVVERWRPA